MKMVKLMIDKTHGMYKTVILIGPSWKEHCKCSLDSFA